MCFTMSYRKQWLHVAASTILSRCLMSFVLKIRLTCEPISEIESLSQARESLLVCSVDTIAEGQASRVGACDGAERM
jgi:hypothetical protein